MKRAPPPLLRQPHPPRDLTPPSGVPAAPPLSSAGRAQPATSLAAAAHRPLARPGAAAATRLCFYHSRLGSKAKKCEKGCSYQEN